MPLKLEFVNITQLTEADIVQMGSLRFTSMPPIVNRTLDDDIELFRASLRNFLGRAWPVRGAEMLKAFCFSVRD